MAADDEINIMKSILGDEVVDSSEPGSKQPYIVIAVQPLLPQSKITVEAMTLEQDPQEIAQEANSEAALQRTLSGRATLSRFTITHLAPLTLSCSLPPSYPDEDPPEYSLSCCWLDRSQLTKLIRALDEIWRDNIGSGVLYLWTDWLKNNTMAHLNITDCIRLSDQEVEEQATQADKDKADVDDAQADNALDARAIMESTSTHENLMDVLRFNSQAAQAEFEQARHDCNVCFDSVPGTEMVRLAGCGHITCRRCLQEACRVHIGEGSLTQLGCPECGESLRPNLIRDLMGEECYERWEQMLTSRALDTMDDICYCPRCKTAVIKDEGDEIGRCVKCFYVFCSLCGQGYHPGMPCLNASEKMEYLKEQAARVKDQAGNRKAREEMMEALRRKMDELNSLKTIISVTRPCPNCKTAIQKSEGCNKMTCSLCNTYFCYVCGRAITGYTHFDTSCFLFDIEGEVQRPMLVRRNMRPMGMMEADIAQQHDLPLQRCPQCHQRNVKHNQSNHMRCWNCATAFCFICQAALRKGVVHFKATGCPQHS